MLIDLVGLMGWVFLLFKELVSCIFVGGGYGIVLLFWFVEVL